MQSSLILVIYERLMKIMAFFKKVSAATLALLISASTVSASAAGTKILLSSRIGDADNNGSINARDFVSMADYIVNGGTTALGENNTVYNCDYNFDGKSDVKDLVFLKNVLLGEKLEQFDAYAAYTSMVAAYISADKSKVYSEVTSELDLDESTRKLTKTTFTRTGKRAEVVAFNDSVNQDVIFDNNTSSLDVYTKSDDKSGTWTKTEKDKTSTALKEAVAEIIKKAQFGDKDVASVNIIEAILLSNNVTKESFANAYTYEDETNKYMAVPVEDIVKSEGTKDTAGTYIIKMTKDNAPVRIDIVIGTSTLGETVVVENGFAEFTLGDSSIAEINLPDITSPTSAPVSPSPTSTPVSPSPTSTPVSPSPTSTPVSPSPESENPFDKGDPVDDYTVFDILKKSAKAFADVEYSEIKGETSETAVNKDVKYSNKAKVNGVKDEKNIELNVTDGELVYDADTYSYTSHVFGVYGGKTDSDIYADTTITNGDNKLNTGWLYKKSDVKLADVKAEGISAAKTVYANVLDDMIADKMVEVNKAKADAEKAQKDADTLEAKVNKAKADAEADKKALEDESDAKKAELQAKVDALEAKIDNAKPEDKEALEAEKKALEDEKAEVEATLTAKKNALEVKYNAIKDECEAEKARLEAERNRLLTLKAKFEKEEAEFEAYKKSAVEAAKAQFDLVFPTKTELKDMFKGDNAAKSRINNNSTITEVKGNENQLMITIDAKALSDGSEKYIGSATGELIYVVDKNTWLPIHAEIRKNSSVTASDLNKGVGAVVETAILDFEYPTSNKATVSIPDEAKKGADPVEYVKKNADFTKFAAKEIANKVKVSE